MYSWSNPWYNSREIIGRTLVEFLWESLEEFQYESVEKFSEKSLHVCLTEFVENIWIISWWNLWRNLRIITWQNVPRENPSEFLKKLRKKFLREILNKFLKKSRQDYHKESLVEFFVERVWKMSDIILWWKTNSLRNIRKEILERVSGKKWGILWRNRRRSPWWNPGAVPLRILVRISRGICGRILGGVIGRLSDKKSDKFLGEFFFLRNHWRSYCIL